MFRATLPHACKSDKWDLWVQCMGTPGLWTLTSANLFLWPWRPSAQLGFFYTIYISTIQLTLRTCLWHYFIWGNTVILSSHSADLEPEAAWFWVVENFGLVSLIEFSSASGGTDKLHRQRNHWTAPDTAYAFWRQCLNMLRFSMVF